MTDLNQLLGEIQRPDTSHVDLIKRRCKGTLQWFLEKDCRTHRIHDNNALQFLMCGEEGFGAIEKDIRAATSSIDLVLWGFDPGMALVRSATTWPHGTTYGELLVDKARQGVKVRLLLWWDSAAINKAAGNVPDFPLFWMPTSWSRKQQVQWPDDPIRNDERTNPAWVLQERHNFCRKWWEDALAGRFQNLEVRLRRGHPLAIGASLAKYLPDSGHDLSEKAAMALVGTHHQKPILIDYMTAAGKTPNTCGYVMGLNSVTDYWDAIHHGFNDPRRELSLNAYPIGEQKRWHRRPYRDYAIRVEGEALHSLNENFVEGWDSADGVALQLPSGATLARINGAGRSGKKLKDERAGVRTADLIAPDGVARCRVQILRTQPERQDATILKGYTLASANAINYIYVENQYFQLAEWPRLLRDMRSRYRQAMKQAGAAPSDMAPLHLFVVIPQPERAQMVPRTYDTVGGLGAGAQMDGYDQAVQGERKRREEPLRPPPAHGPTARDVADYEKQLRARQMRERSRGDDSTMESVSADAVPADIRAQLQTLGIKPLVAMLMTYDHANEARDIRLKARDSDAQEAQARQQARTGGKNATAWDVEQGNLSEHNIIPARYREIYIHSKLMFVDDVYTMLGSANLNARSMAGDSELNLCTEEWAFTREARRRVWGNLAGADLDGKGCSREETGQTHEDWLERMKRNTAARVLGQPPENRSFIHLFEDPRGVPWIRLA